MEQANRKKAQFNFCFLIVIFYSFVQNNGFSCNGIAFKTAAADGGMAP